MSLNPGSRGVTGQVVLVCGAITAGAGALILVGWAIGSDALTAMGTGYIPMAPNTALLFALLGSAVLVREVWPASRGIHRAAAAAALLSAVVAGVTLIGFAIDLNIDDWLFRTTRMLGAVPVGRMSPVTAFCFVLAGVSLLLLECQARTGAAILGTVITLVGAVCLMGYWFGAPLLYGSTITPVALPTSLALVALGIGLTAAPGPDTWPLSTLIGPSTRARLLRALLPTVMVLALINDWITAILFGPPDPGVVLASAITAISFLLVISYAIMQISGAIGDALDRAQAERKRVEEALRESENLFRTLANTTSTAIFIYQGERVVYANRTAELLSGYSGEELLAMPFWRVLHPQFQELVRARGLARQAGGKVPEHYEVQIKRKDGSERWIDFAAGKINWQGQPAVLGTGFDISDRKRVERELQHKTELAQLLEQLARAANEAVSPEAAMEICLRRICEDNKWALGRVAMFSPDLSQRKPDHSLWFCAEPARFDAFMRYSDGYEFMGERSVFINLVLRDQRPVWLPDLTALDRTNPSRLAMAAEAGLMAAFAFPVIVSGEVAAFLEFFTTETQPPDALFVEGTIGLASQFARLIERSRADKARTKLAAIVEYSNDAIIGRAIDGTITAWNAAAERLFGYSAAEVIGRDPVEISPLELRPKIAEVRNLIKAGQVVPNIETVRIAKDGRRIDVTVSVSSIRDSSGRIVGTSTIFHDITERKRAEMALKDSEDRYRDLVEHSQDLICTHDLDGRILSANPRPAEVLGYGQDEFLNMNIRDVLAPETREEFSQYIAELRRTGVAKGLMRVCTRAGERRIWEYVNTLRTEGISTPVIRGMARDVTERMDAERALRKRELLLRNVLETLPVGVWVTDDKSKIVSGNPVGHGIWAGAKYVGIEQHGEYKGWWAATGKRIEAEEWASARAVTKAETSLNEEIEIECFDGTRKTILNSAVPIRDSNQRITGAIVVNQDITERKRAEQILRSYSARLQTVSRKLLEVQEDERRRLARELHDQVGQVLTALKINLQVIERQTAAAPVALKIEECAQIADAALQQVRTLMLDLRPPQLDELGLAIALRAHGERVLAPANLVLHFSARDALPEMPPAIEIVCFRIMQETLTNILRHAGARNVWIELAVTGDGLALTVRDDGKGFDLTEAHQRVMGGGSIGLLSMEERAALADGRIEISTAPGAGTTVRAMFSLQAAQSTVDTG